MPGRRRVRRDVHREHDGFGDRSAWDVASVQFVNAGRGSTEKRRNASRAGDAIRKLLELDLKPRDIMTRQAFENAMVLVTVLGGSTNAVLHLIAIARAVGMDADHRRFSTRERSDAVARRLQAERPVCDGRFAGSRRHSGGDEDAAGGRAALTAAA